MGESEESNTPTGAEGCCLGADRVMTGSQAASELCIGPFELDAAHTTSKRKRNRRGTLDYEKEASHAVMCNYEYLKMIGEGSYAEVWLTRHTDSGELFANKVFNKRALQDKNCVARVFKEKEVLQKMRHPLVISLCAAFQSEDELVLVTPYMAGGDLYSLLEREQKLIEPVAVFYAAELVLAIEYLHSEDIVFRDIKPENILLDRSGHIKVCDFGFVKELPQGEEGNGARCRSLVGTAEYMAPEVVLGEGHSFEADWWSLGVVILEMLCGLGQTPFTADGDPTDETFPQIAHTELHIPRDRVSKVAAALVCGLLARTPSERLGHQGACEVKEHGFFSKMDWKALAEGEVPPPEDSTMSLAPPEMKPLEEHEDDFADFTTYVAPDNGTVPPKELRRDTCNACRSESGGCLVQ